jgi:hypothetical protein
VGGTVSRTIDAFINATVVSLAHIAEGRIPSMWYTRRDAFFAPALAQK